MAGIVLVRHCEAVGNVAFHNSFFNEDDSMYTEEFMRMPSGEWPLTEYGRIHAQEIGSYLGNIRFDDVYVSDARRTLESVGLMGIPADKFTIVDLLRERDYGGMERKPKKCWLDLCGSLDEAFRSMTWKPTGGESMLDVHERAVEFFRTFIYEDRTSLVVTHGDFIQAMRMALAGLNECQQRTFRAMKGNFVRAGQVFLFERRADGTYFERSVHFDGKEWKEIGTAFDFGR